MSSTELLLSSAVAAMIGRDQRTVARLAKTGQLVPALIVPGKRGWNLFRREDVEAYLAEREAKQAS